MVCSVPKLVRWQAKCFLVKGAGVRPSSEDTSKPWDVGWGQRSSEALSQRVLWETLHSTISVHRTLWVCGWDSVSRIEG